MEPATKPYQRPALWIALAAMVGSTGLAIGLMLLVSPPTGPAAGVWQVIFLGFILGWGLVLCFAFYYLWFLLGHALRLFRPPQPFPLLFGVGWVILSLPFLAGLLFGALYLTAWLLSRGGP